MKFLIRKFYNSIDGATCEYLIRNGLLRLSFLNYVKSQQIEFDATTLTDTASAHCQHSAQREPPRGASARAARDHERLLTSAAARQEPRAPRAPFAQ